MSKHDDLTKRVAEIVYNSQSLKHSLTRGALELLAREQIVAVLEGVREEVPSSIWSRGIDALLARYRPAQEKDRG